MQLKSDIDGKTECSRVRHGRVVDGLREHGRIVSAFGACARRVFQQVAQVAAYKGEPQVGDVYLLQPFRGEGVADRQLFELDIRGVVYKLFGRGVVAANRAVVVFGRDGYGVLQTGSLVDTVEYDTGSRAVFGAFGRTVAGGDGFGYRNDVAAEAHVEHGREEEALVAERRGYRHEQVGLYVTDTFALGAAVRLDHGHTVAQNQVAVLVAGIEGVGVDVAQASALFGTYVDQHVLVLEVEADVFGIVVQLHYRGVVVGQTHVEVKLEVFGLDRRGVQHQLDALVEYLAGIDILGRELAGHGHDHDLVFGEAAVVGEVEPEPVVEELHVETGFVGRRNLGFQVGVGLDFRVADFGPVYPLGVGEVVVEHIGVGVLTYLGGRQTQFTEGNPRGESHVVAAHHVAEYPAEVGRGVEVGAVVLGQGRRPVVTGREVEGNPFVPGKLQGTEYRPGFTLGEGLFGGVLAQGRVVVPDALLGHVLGVARQAAGALVHDVSTQRVSQAEALGKGVVSQNHTLDVVLVVALFHRLVRLFALVVDTVGAVLLFDAGIVVVEGVFTRGIEPGGEVDLDRVVTEGAPTLVHVAVLVVDVVGVQLLQRGVHVVDVTLGVAAEGLQVVQRDVAGNVEQLVYLAALTVLGTVGGLGAAQRDFRVHAQVFVHLHAGLEVDVDFAQPLAVEEALALGAAERGPVVVVLFGLADGYVVGLGKAGVEILVELVAVVLVLQLLTQPAGIGVAVERGAETLEYVRVEYAAFTLSVGGLLLERRGYAGPGEVARVGDAESFLLDTAFRGDEDDTVSGS